MTLKSNTSISNISSSFFYILAIGILSFLFLQIFTVNSKAYNCKECYYCSGTDCYQTYGSAGCYNRRPAWGACDSGYCSSNVNSNPAAIGYCASLTGGPRYTSQSCQNCQNNVCPTIRNWATFYWCPNGSYGARALTSGTLFLYSGQTSQTAGMAVTLVNNRTGASGSYGPGNNQNTGITVNTGDLIYVYNNTYPSSPGWMNDLNPQFNGMIAANGQTLISAQAWADWGDGTNFGTYDFNDGHLALSVKSTSLACGASGCNSSTCAAGNSCISNVCQVNCPAGTTRSGYCACLPPVACGASGCSALGCTSGNTCNANICQANCPAGTFRSGNCACIAECQTTDITLSSNPSNLTSLVLGVNLSVNLIRTGPAISSYYVMLPNTLTLADTQTPSSAFNCGTWAPLQLRSSPASVTCSVDSMPPFTEPRTPVTWTHSWCNTDNGSCTGKKTCSVTLPIKIDPYYAYLQTDLGNTHISGNLTMPGFPIRPLSEEKLAAYNYSTNGTTIPMSAIPTWLSTKNYLLFNYSDANVYHNSSGVSAIYEYVKSRLSVAAKTVSKTADLILTNTNYSEVTNNYDTVDITGNLTLSSASCNSKTIFFVSGNLIINSNFDTNGDNSCLFVVKGSTTVGPSVSSIEAFIITDGFISQLSPTQLILTGGLIVQGANTFNRNINIEHTVVGDIVKTTPSELFIYEGARYIKLIGFLLYDSTSYNIKEIQYSGKAPN